MISHLVLALVGSKCTQMSPGSYINTTCGREGVTEGHYVYLFLEKTTWASSQKPWVLLAWCPGMACPHIFQLDVTFTEVPVLKRQKESIILFFVLKNLGIIQRPAQFLKLLEKGIMEWVSLIFTCSRTTGRTASKFLMTPGMDLRGGCDNISQDIDVGRSLPVNTTWLFYFSSHRCLYICRR